MCRVSKKTINVVAYVNVQDAVGFTPLNRAAKLSYCHLVYYFTQLGTDSNIDSRDGFQECPLHWAGWKGNYKVARLLLKHSTNPNAKNNKNVTPIDLTIRQEHKKLETLFKRRKYKKLKSDYHI